MSEPTGRGYNLRLVSAAVLLAIGLVGLIHLPRIWTSPAHPTQTALGFIEVYNLSTPTVTDKSAFAQLLEATRARCPEDRPFIVLGDEVPLYLLTDAYMYPRKIVRMPGSEPLEPSALEAGGCIGAYRENVSRVMPVLEQVEPLACSEDGCIYYVK
jgi:hypothetical protein